MRLLGWISLELGCFDGFGLDSLSRLSKDERKPRQDEADAGTALRRRESRKESRSRIVLRERCRRRLRRFRFCAIISDCLESSMCWTGMEMI